MPYFRSGIKKSSGGSVNPDLSYTVCYVKNGENIPLKSSVYNGMANMNLNKPVTIGANVINCSHLFYGTNVNHPVTIPNSVIDCSYMFTKTYNFAIDIPDSVVNCSHMFGAGATQPVTIGNNVQDCSNMFLLHCNYPITIPNSVINCSGMFLNTNFNYPIVIPNSVIDCSYMFSGYGKKEIDQPIVIPDSVRNCRGMFHNDRQLINRVNIGNNVIDCSAMFRNAVHVNGYGEYSSYVIPKNVQYANYMFHNANMSGARIYINGNPTVKGMFNMLGNIIVYCGRNVDVSQMWMFNDTYTYALTARNDGNGYYNSYLNVNVYNNYVGT